MRAQYNYVALTKLHLNRNEFYRMHPGLFHDMVQLYMNSLPHHGNEDVD